MGSHVDPPAPAAAAAKPALSCLTTGSIIPRVHWLEIHEEPWCPVVIRQYVQDFLRWLWEALGYVGPVVDILAKAIKDTGSSRVVDLCSGGGGPYRALLPTLKKKLVGITSIKMTLTDLYPNIPAWKELSDQLPDMDYVSTSVDATKVPEDLKGFRTLFTCLHHFQAPLVEAMLQDAVDKREGIAVFELTDRSIFYCLAFLVSIPILGVLHAITRRPFSLQILVIGLLLPIGTLVNLHDSITSNLRTYTIDEMRAMVSKLARTETFIWEVGYRRSSPYIPFFIRLPYLIGVPRKDEQVAL